MRHQTLIRAGAIICLLAIVLGPLYSEPGYDWVRHSVSELAGQSTRNAWIMRLGLICLGLAAAIGHLREPSKFNVFFLFFGGFIVLAAVFPHRPFLEGRAGSELMDRLHSVGSTLGGLSAVSGFVLKSVRAGSMNRKLVYAIIAAAYTILPIGMFMLPAYQGLFQRIIFGSFILWMLVDKPE